jgi:hypothetical protein
MYFESLLKKCKKVSTRNWSVTLSAKTEDNCL